MHTPEEIAGLVMAGLIEAAESGDRRATLEALRDYLAAIVVIAEPRSVAPLARQLAEVVRELDAMPVGNEESKVDELAQRRLDRLAKPHVSDGPGKGVVGGS